MSNGNPEQTKKNILKVARNLFEKKTYKEVKLADIAKNSGVSRQSIYLHFNNKTGLLLSLVQYVDEVHELESIIEEIHLEKDIRKLLFKFIDAWSDYLPKIDKIANYFYSMKRSDKDIESAWNERMDYFFTICEDIVKKLKKSNHLSENLSVKRASEIMWLILSIKNWNDLTVDKGWSKEEYKKQMKMMIGNFLLKGDK